MKKLMFLTLALGLLGWQGCKRCDDPSDPECRNYDPCYAQGAVSAEFEMFETGFGWPQELAIYGKVHSCNSLILRAKQDLESYEWQIGSEPEPRTGQSVTVSFGCIPYRELPIRLIAKGQPNLACDPEDDGIDTVLKYVSVVDPDSLAIAGKFKGHHQHLQEEDFVIEIRLRPDRPYMDSMPPPPTASWGFYLMNLPKGTPRPQWGVSSEWIYTQISPLGLLPGGEGFWTYSYSGSGNGWNSYEPEGCGRLSADGDSLTIRYTILDSVQFFATPPAYVRNDQDTLTFIGIRQ